MEREKVRAKEESTLNALNALSSPTSRTQIQIKVGMLTIYDIIFIADLCIFYNIVKGLRDLIST